MDYKAKLHPQVAKFLDSLSEHERIRCITALKELEQNPFIPRSGADIKKLKGKRHEIYRLRIGDYRFEYFVESGNVWVVRAFRREEGY